MKAKFYGTDLIKDCVALSSELARFDDSRYGVFPGFCDVHVHFREPGFSYKETIKTGSLAAARGGYTAVCTMPNLNPVPDSVENLNQQREIIEKDACIHVYPYGAITVGEKGETLADLEGMAPFVCGFSDDGRGVQRDEMMREAMIRAKAQGKMIVAHCEVNDLLRGGYIHDGAYAKEHGHRGICSESEWAQIARDIELIRETGCAYHVCHISTKESVEIIRKAKAEGLDITCETGPHYLVMNDIDMLATDHAPHSEEEKGRGLEKSVFGIVGLETAFPIMYTYLVKPGIMTMERLMEVMVENPRKRFNLPLGTDFSVWDLEEEYEIDPEEFLSMGKATTFNGWKVNGRCKATVCDGKLVYTSN